MNYYVDNIILLWIIQKQFRAVWKKLELVTPGEEKLRHTRKSLQIFCLKLQVFSFSSIAQQTYNCSESSTEALENGVRYVQSWQ